MAAQPRIGYVLSSGGIRGIFAHTGFLQALDELHIPLVAGAGCSAGAVVGGIVASGTGLDQWISSLSYIDRQQFWNPDPMWKFLWQMTARRGRGYTGLSDTAAAQEFCRQNLAVQSFEDCRYPFFALAVSLAKSEKTIFNKGELAPRIVASAAMPLLYRPVEIDGDLFCDGAVVDLAPIDSICCQQSLDVVIVHHVSRRTGTGMEQLQKTMQAPWTLVNLLDRLLYHHRPWYLSDQPISFQRCRCGCGAVIVVLEPELMPMEWPLIEGGMATLESAGVQTANLLQPYIQSLISKPREALPGPG